MLPKARLLGRNSIAKLIEALVLLSKAGGLRLHLLSEACLLRLQLRLAKALMLIILLLFEPLLIQVIQTLTGRRNLLLKMTLRLIPCQLRLQRRWTKIAILWLSLRC